MHKLTRQFKKRFGQLSTRPVDSEPTLALVPDDGNSSSEGRTERFGLLPVAKAPNTAATQQFDVDIIAIHGLNGNAFTTWTHANGTFWLQDLLPECLPGSRIFTYGYPSQVAFNSSYATVRDYARRLLSSVQSMQAQSKEVGHRALRPVIFICHSLGGIVCKQALVIAHEENKQYDSILKAVNGVIFLGTPHQGSKIADVGTVVGMIINLCSASPTIRTDLLDILKYDSAVLHQLSVSVRQRLEDLDVVTFYETAPTPPLRSLIVEESSACIGIAHEILVPLFENHRDICRFSGNTDGYKLVLYHIREIALKRSTSIQYKERSDTRSSNRSLSATEKECVTLFRVYDVADYLRSLPRPAKGTFQWILSHPLFDSWQVATRSAVLWLTGHPGCGKTTLSSFLMDYLRQTQTDSEQPNVYTYFCDDKINKQKDGKAVLLGLIFQLLSAHRSLVRYAKKAFELQGAGLAHSFAALWNVFQRIVSDPKSGSVFIIIDALDECEATTRHELLMSIHDMIQSPGSAFENGRSIKFILSSRPYFPGSERSLGYFENHRLSIDEVGDAYIGDLEIYIDQRVCEIAERYHLSSTTKQYLHQSLLTKADRTFLWVHMVFSSLDNHFLISTKDFRKLVDEIPTDLQATYHRFLVSIPAENQAAASKLLSLILGSFRLLELHEINIAFTLDPDHHNENDVEADLQPSMARTLQGILGSLIRVSGSKVSLVHQSAKEFLTIHKSTNTEIAPGFSSTPENIALSITEACIQYLTLDDFSGDLFTLDESPDETDSDVSDDLRNFKEEGLELEEQDLGIEAMFLEYRVLAYERCNSIAQRYQFYDYASINWAHHFKKCQAIASPQLKEAARHLLQTDYCYSSNWLRYFWLRSKALETVASPPSDLLELTAYFGFDEIVAELLSEGIHASQGRKDAALFWAATNNHSKAVQLLLSAAADPNAYSSASQTPLISAAVRGHYECLTVLLNDKRTDINSVDGNGRSALSLACRHGHESIAKVLLRTGRCMPDLADNSGATPLLWAAGGGYAQIVLDMLKQPNVNPNHQDSLGRTAVSWAASDGMTACLKTLLNDKRVDVNLDDHRGRSPLIWAARNGQNEVIRTLTRRRTLNRDKMDQGGRNSISWACGSGQADTVQLLLRSGCTGVNQKDNDGWSPLAWAIERDSPNTVRTLLSTGLVDLEARDSSGKTALYWAVSYSHVQLVRTLLKEGADPGTRADDGKTALSLAQDVGHPDIMEELQLLSVGCRH
ncbi:hypothetical protein PG989_005635 [Apiospora arundinis]